MKNRSTEGCGNILTNDQKYFYISGLHVYVSTTQKSGHLIGLRSANGVRGTLEGNDHHAAESVFPFNAPIKDCATGFMEETEIPNFYTCCFDLVNIILFRRNNMKQHVMNEILKYMKDVKSGYRALSALDLSPFKHFKISLKQVVCMASTEH